MYTILSLAKNNLIRSSVFLPADFGLLAFSINNNENSSLEGSGPKRERAEVDLKTDKPQLETQVALPSQLSLDDFLIPNNAGILEKKAFFVASPQSPIILGYLAFDSNSRAANSINPRYLVYRAIEFPAQNYSGYALPQDDASYQGQTAYEFASKPFVQYETSQIIGQHYILPLIKPSEFLRDEFAYQTHAQAFVKGYDFSVARPVVVYGLKHVIQSGHASPKYDMPRHAIETLNGNFWQTTSSFIGVYKPTDAKLGQEKVQTRKTLENVIAKTDIPMTIQSQIPQAPQLVSMQPPKYGKGVDIIVSYFAGKSSLPYEITPKIQIPVLGISLGAILAILNPFRASDSNKTQNNALHNYQKPDISKVTVMAPPQAQQYILEESLNGNQEHNSSGQQNSYKAKDKAQATNGKTQTSNVIYLSDYRNPRRRGNSDWKPRDAKSKYKAILRESTRKLKEATKRSVYLLTLARATSNQIYSNTKHLYSKLKGKIESIIYNYRASPAVQISESLNDKTNSDNQPNPNAYLELLENRAKYLEYKTGAKVAYIVMDGLTGEIYADRNADDSISAGSLPKIFIAKLILELSQQGKINLDSVLQLRASQKPKNFTNMEKPITIKEGLREMLSDEYGNSNWIGTALWEMIGIKRGNKMLEQQGYHQTVIGDYFRPTDLYREKIKTSARDVGRAMFELVTGKGFDEYHHKITLEILNTKELYPMGDLAGIDKANVFGKKGQSECDISTTYAFKSEQNGQGFNRIGVFIQSSINKRIVKGDFKTPAPSGVETMGDHLDTSGQFYKTAQSIHYKPA